MDMSLRRKLLHRALCVTALFAAGSAAAEEQSFDDLLALDLESLLNVKVNSSRSSESYRESANTMTVVNAKQIDQYRLNNLYDLAYLVPNFSFRRSFGRWQERPAMRGVTAIAGAPTTGLLIDGMSADAASTITPLFDLKQVEVLRGPEAAMFGRSTFNGAVNLVSQKPEEGYYTRAQLSAGSNNLKQVKLLTNMGSDTLSFRLSTSVDERGTFANNTLGEGGGGYGDEKTHYAKLAGKWNISDELELFAYHSIVKSKDGMLPVYLQNATANNCFLETRPQYYCGEINNPDELGYSRYDTLWDYSLDKNVSRSHINLSYTKDNFDVRFAHASSDSDLYASFDGDFYELNSFFGINREDEKTHSTELFSNFRANGIRYLIGISRFSSDLLTSNQSSLYSPGNISPLPLNQERTRITNHAVFGSIDAQLPDSYRVLVDVRYAHDEVAFKAGEQGENGDGSADWRGIQPRISAAKTWGSNWVNYLSLSKGSKPGGFNSTIASLDVIDDEEKQRVEQYLSFDQEDLINLELGFKGALISRRLFFSSAIYTFKWNDLQLSEPLEYTNSSGDIVRAPIQGNGGAAEGSGLELELKAKINDHVGMQLNYGFAQTRLSDTETSAQLALTSNGSVDGHDVPVAPNQTAALGLNYNAPVMRNWQFNSNALLRYESKRWVAEHNLAYAPQTLQLDFEMGITRGPVKVSIWGKNLSEGRSPESAARFGDAATFFVRRGFAITMAEPRTVGIGLDLKL